MEIEQAHRIIRKVCNGIQSLALATSTSFDNVRLELDEIQDCGQRLEYGLEACLAKGYANESLLLQQKKFFERTL